MSETRDDAHESDDDSDDREEGDAVDEVDHDDAGGGRAGRDGGGRRGDDAPPVRVRELVLLVVAVLAVAGMVFFGLRWKELRDDVDQRADVEQTADAFLNALFEWDGATIDADFDRILSFAAGQFREEAEATFGDEETRRQLRENRASERAEGVDVFVQSLDGDSASVFAVVDVTAVNAELPAPRADTVRTEVSLVRVDGEWKVDAVRIFDGLNLGLPTEAAAG